MNQATRRVLAALVTAAVIAGAAACGTAQPDCSGGPRGAGPGSTILDLKAVTATPAREGCEFEVEGTATSPEDAIWLNFGLASSGDRVIVAYPFTESDEVVAPGVGVVNIRGKVDWLREPGEGDPDMSTWLADVTEEWVLWADGRSADISSLDAQFWSADRRNGRVRLLGETSTDAHGLARTVSGYNRPTVVDDWGFWVDVKIGDGVRPDTPQVVGAPMDGSREPVPVGRGFLATADRCGPVPAVVFAELEDGPSGPQARVVRVPVTDDGPGEPEMVDEFPLPVGGTVSDLAACAATVVVAQEAPVAGVSAAAADETTLDDGVEGAGAVVSTLLVAGGDHRLEVVGATSVFADVAVTPEFVAFSDVDLGNNTAAHYLYRLDDGALMTVPTDLGVGQVFEMRGDRATWLRPVAGHAAEEALMDVTLAEQVVVKMLAPVGADR